MSSSSWESLKSGFMQIRKDCAIDPPLKPAGRLKAIWNAFVKPRWTFEYWGGNDGVGATERFKWHAQKAAALLRYSGRGEDAVWFWLDRMSRHAPSAYVGLDHPQMREIFDICGLSAEYCTKCEADAISSQNRAEAQPVRATLRRIAEEPIRQSLPTRHEIQRFANEAFTVARDRILRNYAAKERQVLGAAERTGNSAAYLPALINLKAENVRDTILAQADALAGAFALYELPCDAYAEQLLKASAHQIAGGSISAVRGQLQLRSRRLRISEKGRGMPWHREIQKSMHSALKEGLLRLSRQRIQFGNSKSSSGREPPAKKAPTIQASGNTASVERLERSVPQESIEKKRGRPQTISDEKKTAALQLKESGGTNRQAAALLYGTKYPTSQQTKNVPAILRHHKLKSKQSGSPANGRKASPTPRRSRG
jgi:hypothetical protein